MSALARALGYDCCTRFCRRRPHRERSPDSKPGSVTESDSSACGGSPMDYNIYATRKTVAQGMMDIALMTSNASQLKYLLIHGVDDEHFLISVTLIGISITLQVMVGVLLIFLGRWNLNYVTDQRKSDFLNNVIIVFVFLITVVNVLISAFGSGAPKSSGEGIDTQWRVYKGINGVSDSKSANRYERSIEQTTIFSNCTLPGISPQTDLLFF